MPEVEISCIQCKGTFIFSEKEQAAFYVSNLMAPQRCPKCRSKKAALRESAPTKYEIVCDHCGKKDLVPFQPKTGRSVLCRECFQANKARMRMA